MRLSLLLAVLLVGCGAPESRVERAVGPPSCFVSLAEHGGFSKIKFEGIVVESAEQCDPSDVVCLRLQDSRDRWRDYYTQCADSLAECEHDKKLEIQNRRLYPLIVIGCRLHGSGRIWGAPTPEAKYIYEQLLWQLEGRDYVTHLYSHDNCIEAAQSWVTKKEQ